MEETLKQILNKLNEMDTKIDKLDMRLGYVETKVSDIDERLIRVEDTVNRIERSQQDEVKGMLNLIDKKVSNMSTKLDIDFVNRRVADMELEMNRIKNKLNS